MNYARQRGPTEECPLTKEKRIFSLGDCCGFRTIISSFAALTVVITAALVLQLIYDDDGLQGKLNAHGAVATDYANCSQIGTKILQRGGNAVDAAVAAALCMTVVAPHKTSLGSGGYIVIYRHKDQDEPRVVDFLNNTLTDEFKKRNIRIPAVLKGLEFAHSLYGRLAWKDVVEPSAVLASKGFEVSRDFANEAIKNVNLQSFGKIEPGEILKLPKLAVTLDGVSKFGTKAFYNGTLTSEIVTNISANAQLLHELASYKCRVIKTERSTLSQYEIFYPANLNFLRLVIEELNKLNISKDNASTVESAVSVAETLIQLIQAKMPYVGNATARRYTGVAAVDWEDTYVSIITGLGGAADVAQKTESEFFFDTAGNADSLFALTPVIFYDGTSVCGLRGVLSADDPVTIGQILYNLLLRSMNISTAVEYPRYYVLPDGVTVENDEQHAETKILRDSLMTVFPLSETNANTIMKSINGIVMQKNVISGHSDSRDDGFAIKF